MTGIRSLSAASKRPLLLTLLFLFVFAAEFALGFYYAYTLNYTHSDAMSRVANAFYVLYSRDPHLAAIGFVWNPLPSLVDMLFLLAYPVLPSVATFGLAGVAMSSLFAAATASLLAAEALRYGHGVFVGVSLALAYCLNPFIFLFGSNGLSDAAFNFFIMWTVMAFVRWFRDEKPFGLVTASFTLALAFWTRYEAVPFGAALCVGTLTATLLVHRRMAEKPLEQRRWKYQSFRGEGTLVLLLSPVVYSGLLWILWNYLIMGNPLYFLNSEYSNVAQAGILAMDSEFTSMVGSPKLALLKVLEKTAYYAVPLGAIALLRMLGGRLLRWDFIVLVLLFVSIPALQLLMLLKGTSFAWFRYFMYGFPITVAWLPYEMGQIRKWKKAGRLLLLASLVGSAVLLTYAMSKPEIAPDEHAYITTSGHLEEQRIEQSIADYFNENLPDAVIMMDSYSAYRIILKSGRPERYVITSDRIFRKAMSDPHAYGIDYILLPRPTKESDGSAINVTYPNLYANGAEWCELYREFGDNRWRLYKVTGPTGYGLHKKGGVGDG
ncbi:hypothetical protein PV407_12705 [Paenibacillus sp. GYB003]